MKWPILLLLATVGVYGQGFTFSDQAFMCVVNPPPSGGAAPTYLIKQGFEGTGYDNSETWTESGDGTIDEDYTSSPLVGSQSLRLVDSTQLSRIEASFTGQAECWSYVRVKPVSWANQRSIIVLDNGSGTLVFELRLMSDGTVLLVVGAQFTSTVGTMTAGNTYHVWGHYLKGSGANAVGEIGFSTDGTKPTSGNNYAIVSNGNATANASRIYVGDSPGAGNNSREFIFDSVRVDDASIGDNPQ